METECLDYKRQAPRFLRGRLATETSSICRRNACIQAPFATESNKQGEHYPLPRPLPSSAFHSCHAHALEVEENTRASAPLTFDLGSEPLNIGIVARVSTQKLLEHTEVRRHTGARPQNRLPVALKLFSQLWCDNVLYCTSFLCPIRWQVWAEFRLENVVAKRAGPALRVSRLGVSLCSRASTYSR